MASANLTKKAFANSLKRLMKEKPLNKISVTELVTMNGVNRQTFYYHFHDLYELVEWIYIHEALERIEDYKSYDTWQEGFLRIFKYIESNKSFCYNTLNSLGRNHLDYFIFSATRKLLMDVLIEVSPQYCVDDEALNFTADYYTHAFTGLVIQWMHHGMKERPERIIEHLSTIMEGNFRKALESFESKQSL